MKATKIYILLLTCALFASVISACEVTPASAPPTPTPKPTKTAGPPPIINYTYNIVKTMPHDTSAFTEGLTILDGKLYESNGQNGASDVRIVDLKTGAVKNSVKLDAQYFGEGMTILKGKIFQLTWQNHQGFIYDENTLAKLGDFAYTNEGWGLTNDGRFLIMSDGTNAITYLNPETFQVQKIVYVYDKGQPLPNINELEYIKGVLYANIWHTDKVVEIDPALGEIIGWIDFSGLRSPEAQQNQEAVLNGIAYDSASDQLFVTGKLWDKLFEVKLIPAP